MPEFTLRQHGPRSTSGTAYKFHIEKLGHNMAEVKVDGATVASYAVDTRTGDLSGKASQIVDSRIITAGGSQAPVSGQPAPAAAAKATTTAIKGQLQKNWRIDEGVFYIRPRVGDPDETEIGIGIVDGHESTPAEAHEIVGQDLMLFSIAAGIFHNVGSLLQGPTGVGKTSAYRWLAKTLGFAYYVMPISASTEASHLVGEYLPMESEDSSKVPFGWTYGVVGEAVLASAQHPTILVFEELNRIGRLAELARLYSLLDDSNVLEIKERRGVDGVAEVLVPGELFIGATMNPVDDEKADYLGVQELDPALASRFPYQPTVSYPRPELEAAALVARVRNAGIQIEVDTAIQLVKSANRIRQSADVRFPISFRELYAWATLLPYMDATTAASIAVLPKCPAAFRPDVANLLKLEGR